MNFTKLGRKLFSDLSNSTEVLLTAERDTQIRSIIICNRSKADMKINLQTVALLEEPVQKAFIAENRYILANATVDLLVPPNQEGKDNASIELTLLNGDSLLIYSNEYSQIFDCSVYFYELTELNDIDE